VIVVNGERLMQVPYFKESILGQMDLFKADRIQMIGRMDMISVLKSFPSATFLCHQFNNEFNYMVMELLWAGFPVLHNSGAWREFGYAYSGSDVVEGAMLIEQVRTRHVERLEAYKGHARALAWKHSPYNPDVHRAWKNLLGV